MRGFRIQGFDLRITLVDIAPYLDDLVFDPLDPVEGVAPELLAVLRVGVRRQRAGPEELRQDDELGPLLRPP